MRKGERTVHFVAMHLASVGMHTLLLRVEVCRLERRLGQRRKTGRVRVPDVIVGRTQGGKGVSGQASRPTDGVVECDPIGLL